MKRATTIATGIFMACFAGAALADGHAKGEKPHAGHGYQDEHKDVTKDEMLARAAAHFDRIDTNGDGVLTADEREAAKDKMKERWEKRKSGEWTPERSGEKHHKDR